jgi:hypothetical protein
MPGLQAEELEQAIVAAISPHMRRSDRQRLLARLDKVAHPSRPKPKPVEIVEHDPEKARAWFESMGAQVVH